MGKIEYATDGKEFLFASRRSSIGAIGIYPKYMNRKKRVKRQATWWIFPMVL